MSTWNALGAGGRAAVMIMGAAVVGGIGYMVWDGTAPPAPAPVAANLAEPAAPATPEAAPAASPAPAETAVAPPTAPVAPSFDNWRVEADGSAVVAGRAAPGAVISVLVDGAAVAQAEAANGEFAALFTLPPNDKPSLMTLEAKLPDGTVLASEQTIAIEPIKGPVDVAAAEPAPAPAPAAVMVTEEGASVVQPATPAEPDVLANVSVDAITYTPTGAVQLGGAGTPGQFVRVYLDNAAKVTALIPDSGRWLSTLPAIDPGIYTLRVDQVDDAGKVTSRFETPFKRETPEALAAVATAEPAPEAAATEAAVAPTEPAVAETSAAPAEPAAETAVAEAPAEVAAKTEAATSEAAPATEAPAEPVPAPADTQVAEAAPAEPAAPEPAPVEAAPAESVVEPAPAAAPVTITVQPGFTLWKIAKENFGDGVMYVQVFEANKDKIRDPDLIYPGQVFTIPASE